MLDAAKIKAVLFDVDGTLADTDNAYIQRALGWLKPLRPNTPDEELIRFLRWGVMKAESPANWLMSIPDRLGLDDEIVRLSEWLSDRLGRAESGHFVLMDGAASLVTQLAERYPLAVVTARPARQTQAFVDQFNLGPYFRAVVSAQTAARTKPFPDPVVWAAQALGVALENCLMVGDTTVDIRSGKDAGAQAAGVLCGFGERAELEQAGADIILSHTTELASLLA